MLIGIGICVVIIIAAVIEIFRELHSFRVVRYVVHSNKFAQGEFTPKKVLFLSDLHNQSYGESNRRLLDAIRKECADMIWIGGDMLIGKNGCDYEPALQLVKKLASICPVYYANGNHEQRMKECPGDYEQSYQSYKEQLERAGVHFLENGSVRMNMEGVSFRIYGVEIPKRCYSHFRKPALTQEDIVQCIGTCNQGEYNVLLAHNPCYVDTYVQWGADLVLSGHFHGGIMRIPGVGGVVAPNLQIFPKYSGGRYRKEAADVIVSKGIGAHTIPIRLFNPAELVVLTLCQEESL